MLGESKMKSREKQSAPSTTAHQLIRNYEAAVYAQA